MANFDNSMTNRQLVSRLYRYFMVQKRALSVGLFALILFSMVDAGMIYFIQPLIDDGLNQSDSKILILGAYLTVFIFVIRGITSFISSYCLSYAGSKVTFLIRQQAFEKIQYFSMSAFNAYDKGALLSKLSYDTEQLSEAFLQAVITVIRESIIVIVLLAMMIYASWQLSLVFLIVGPCIAFIITIVSRRFRRVSRQLQAGMGGMTKVAEQAFSAHQEVLVFNAAQKVNQSFFRVNNQTRQQIMKLASVSALSNPIVQLIGASAIALILFFASIESVLSQLSAGAFTMMLLAMGSLLKPLKQLTTVNQKLQKGLVAANSLFSVIDSPNEQDEGQDNLIDCVGKVSLRRLSFSYLNDDVQALCDISATFEAGKVSAIVGGSGAGKTTLANLLMRLYTAPEQSIFIDDQAIENYTLKSLRNRIGYVSQNVTLIDDSIKNNLLFGCDRPVSEQEIHEAVAAANVDEFTQHLPDGLETHIGENGALLSGGQRQRIAIARALIKQSSILILDEATSALDNCAERLVQEALKRLMIGRTVIVIAHRLSTVVDADQIFVMDKGYLVDQGKHQDLLTSSLHYQALFNHKTTV